MPRLPRNGRNVSAIAASLADNPSLSMIENSAKPADLLVSLVDHAPDAMLVVSAQGVIQFANATCIGLLGYDPQELVGQSAEILVPEEMRVAHRASRDDYQDRPLRRSMGRVNALVARTKDGRRIPVDIALSPIGQGQSGSLIAVVIRDATAQRTLTDELERLATTDPLTGALNRRSFENAFAREAERSRRAGTPLFLMMLDIDHFKNINDRYGHAAGDRALTELVLVSQSKLRKTDVLARIGGEEFAVLSSAGEAAEATALAERIRESITAITILSDNGPFGFTVSIGLVEADLAENSLIATLNRADQALYRAKRAGRNRVEDGAGEAPALRPEHLDADGGRVVP